MQPMAMSLGIGLILAFSAFATEHEPVLGGPCEGCQLVFVGMPDTLRSRARIAPADEPGEHLCIEGAVTEPNGRPAAGIIVYAYHTDSSGVYPRGSTRHGRLRGWARTDSTGSYRFDTIRPGAYPTGTTPQHVHMHVIEPGVGTYWIDSIHFTDDPLLGDAERQPSPHAHGGSGLVTPHRDPDGTWRVRRDIVLGLGVQPPRNGP